jgi:phospholipase/carboxylesterase
MLHGAGGHARRLASLLSIANSFGVILLVPDSRGATWDAIRGGFGPDVEFINRALDQAFTRCAVDQQKLAIGGFSDGATYALSLGLDNGSLFTHVMAFSPGFIAPRRPSGKPRIFIAHGRSDTILPIDVTSRRIVPGLEDAGYAVTYQEFDGPHTVPQEIAQDAFKWFAR